ncbi:MAG: hypothetical protein ABIX12_12235 [Rubrivivax sp.]
MTGPGHDGELRRIVRLTWPVLVGRLAVMGFATVDTVVVARHAREDWRRCRSARRPTSRCSSAWRGC